MHKINSILVLSLIFGSSIAVPRSRTPKNLEELWDPKFLEEKAANLNREIESQCDVKVQDHVSLENAEAKVFCKYKDSYRQTIEDISKYNENIDRCNSILCTWYQVECYNHKMNLTEEKIFTPEETICNCLTNMWSVNNCNSDYVHSADGDTSSLSDRFGEDESGQPKEEVLKALEELNELNPAKYSENEQNCFAQKKVFHMGNCHTLKTRGPCSAGKWLVLRKPTRRSQMLIPVCKLKPCNNSEIWSTVLQRCMPRSDFKKRFCDDDNYVVESDVFGDGICNCGNEFVHFPDSDVCYELYQTGPCHMNEVVTYNRLTGLAECSPDKCIAENNGVIDFHKRVSAQSAGDEISFVSERKLYAPKDGIGPCYIFNGPVPCVKDDPHARFVINQETRLPGCEEVKSVLHIIEGPSKCITDESNRCRTVISVKEDNQLDYLLGLKGQFKKKKKRETSKF